MQSMGMRPVHFKLGPGNDEVQGPNEVVEEPWIFLHSSWNIAELNASHLDVIAKVSPWGRHCSSTVTLSCGLGC